MRTNTYRSFVRQPDGKITEFHGPNEIKGGGWGTIAESIDDLGVIGGYYHYTNDLDARLCALPRRYLDCLRRPCGWQRYGQGTFGRTRNLWGASAGGYTDSNNVGHAFYRSPDGKFTNFDAPGAGKGPYPQGTVPSSINASG